MADTSKAIEALTEALPPATDKFTYLTILETHLSPEILPTLNNILQDAQLTQDIGWDLVDMLIPLAGSEPCLETVARLGNPREVILKVLEVLEGLQEDGDEAEEAEEEDEKAASPDVTRKFILLLGMLAILHKRIKTKYPSRFLATSLLTVYRTYRPNQGMTASVLNLVHSLTVQGRPALPIRKSSVNVANPDLDGDASKNAPDPEAEQEDPTEKGIQQKLLLSFVTSILESYVNANDLEYSRRLLEFYNPTKINPTKKSALQAFREDQELLNRDAIVGKLVALIGDLGLSSCSKSFVKDVCSGKVSRDPLAEVDDVSSPDEIGLSTGGRICLLSYWVFSSTVFEANHPKPEMHLFPEHYSLLESFMGEEAQSTIEQTAGTVEAVLVLGLWLEHNKHISAAREADFMKYHHLLTICSVFHPSLYVRNAAVTLAGLVLHDDPDDGDRLKILEDLLENCMFASLKACAVTWLREEIIAAHKKNLHNRFSSSEAIEQLQYSIFPNLASLKDADTDAFMDYWTNNSPFVMQAANFALFLFSSDVFKQLVPAAMGASVEQRYVEPLLSAAASLEAKMGKEAGGDAEVGRVVMELSILQETLKSIPLH